MDRRRVPAPDARLVEQLDLLLLAVAKPRKIHPDGVRFHGLRYLDPTLAAYVGEQIVIRYDLRDLTAARNARRREVRQGLRNRASVVDQLVAVHRPGHDHPAAGTAAAPDDEPAPARRLKLYRED